MNQVRFLRKHFLFLLFFLILICRGAKGQNTLSDKLFAVPLNTAIVNSKEIGLKEIAENIEYIKLEFSNESALGRIQRLVATEKYFFVYDSRGICQFSRFGQFIRKIGKIGRGPGEYPGLKDFAVDESTQQLFILANFQRQIFVYGFNGNFVKSIKLNSEERETIDITQDGLIVLQTHPITKSLLSTEIINQQGTSILKFNSRCYVNSNSIKFAKTPNVSYRFYNNLLFKEGVNDTIYKINSKGIIPYFTYGLGKYQPPVNYPNEERSKYIEIYKICETGKYLITFFFNKGLTGTALYNKITKETIVNIPEDNLKKGVKNDFDNGINFFMGTVPFTLKTNQNELLQVLEPNVLNDYKQDKRITGNFKTIIDNFKDVDNPVVMVIRLK